MNEIPFGVALAFVATTLLCIYFLFQAGFSKKAGSILILGIIGISAIAALNGITQQFDAMPPRLLLLVLPVFLILLLSFVLPSLRAKLDQLDPAKLTLLHSVRIPVEIILYLLFTYGAIPEIMTFDGRNYDILAGLSAPVIYYLGYVKKKVSRNVLIGWNVFCLFLLINIVTTAVLSAPFPFQKLAFDQPNLAVFYFPFIWLPVFIVPAVLFSHLVTIRSLIKSPKDAGAQGTT